MSNSNYAQIKTDGNTDEEESVNFSPVDGDDIVENPFTMNSTNEMEPLHAIQAARRLSVNPDDVPFAPSDTASAGNIGTGEGMQNSSLLERIQQQKMQHKPGTGVTSNAPATTSENQFGYPMTEDTTNYSYSISGPAPGSSMPMMVPDYSSNPAPSPYTSSPYSDDTSTEYKDRIFSMLSTAGSAANSAAKSAYRSSKRIYGNYMNKNGTHGASSAQERMTQMDYQTESLLMDPHDLEASAVSSAGQQGGTSSTPLGLRAGISQADSTVAQSGSKIVACMKQFLVDVKDIFLAQSQRTQIIVVLFLIFIAWLFVSEEL